MRKRIATFFSGSPAKPGQGTRALLALLLCVAIASVAFANIPSQKHPTASQTAQSITTPVAVTAPVAESGTQPITTQTVLALEESATAAGPASAATSATFQAGAKKAVKVEPLTWAPLIARLKKDGFNEAALKTMFADLKTPPLAEFMAYKAIELTGGRASLAVKARKGADFSSPDYSRVAGGVSASAGNRLIASNKAFFASLYKQYGVPASHIVAVLMVETGIGTQLGKHPALLSLGSMAATRSLAQVLPSLKGCDANNKRLDSQIKARSDWAYDELKALIRYAQATGKKPASIPGSVFGAIGICQFMPSNIARFGVSTRGRKMADVFQFNDAAASVARYLSSHGWRRNMTPQGQMAVIRSYNHSDIYASTVYGVAMALSSSGVAAVNARGGNLVKAARDNARGTLAFQKKLKAMGPALGELPSYNSLLE